MICRPQHRNDDPRPIIEQAFGDHGQKIGTLLDALDTAGDTVIDLVAEDDGQVIGHTRLSRSWIDARQRLVEVLVLSPLAVRPDRQRQGAGTALLRAAREAAATHGAPALFLEGPPDYYGTRGFDRADRNGFTRRMTGALVYCQAFWVTDCVGLRQAGPAPSTTPATAH